MNNQVIPIAQGGVAPLATLGAMPAFMQQAAAQSSMGTFGDGFSGGRRVQLKGGQINFLAEDGKPMGAVQDANGTVVFPQYVNNARIIIVGIAPHDNTTYRTYYATQYKEGESLPPDCWSADGVHPSPKSFAPQSHDCASCPKNVTGTSSTGKGKACGSRKKLAVVFADDPAMRVFSMDLSGTALFGKSAREAEGYFTLSEYAKRLKQGGAIWEGVVTEVCFSEGANIGVRFRAIGYATQDQFTRVMAMKSEADTVKALEVDFPEHKLDDGNAPAAATYQAPNAIATDYKASMITNPAFQTTLAHLREWANHPSVTPEMVRAEAAKYNVTL